MKTLCCFGVMSIIVLGASDLLARDTDAMESTIRMGDYKLIHNYDYVNNQNVPGEFELYRLYQTEGDKQVRVDIEESQNLAASMREKTREMSAALADILTEMKASYPYYNPDCTHALPHKEKVCTVLSHEQHGDRVEFTYRENGAKVIRANLIYTLNGGERYEEWFRGPATLLSESKVLAQLPEGTTHYVINLIDENNFLESYPEVMDMITQGKEKKPYSTAALKVNR